jgi:hypothetical protein
MDAKDKRIIQLEAQVELLKELLSAKHEVPKTSDPITNTNWGGLIGAGRAA